MTDPNLSMPAEDPQSLDATTPVEPHQELETVSYLAVNSAPVSPLLESGETHFIAIAPGQTIDEVLIQPRLQRRWRLILVLFVATCVTTFFAGVYQWNIEAFLWFDEETGERLKRNWQDGLLYMLAVMGILLAHEMGHFLTAVRYHVPASYPIFIPVPHMFMGTMGAVIAMDGARADRKQMFDIGVAGPLIGLVVAIPLLCAGIIHGDLEVPHPNARVFGDPLLAELLIGWLRPEAAPGSEIQLAGNPFYMAGWVGMLITGLNMMPVSQLDGGHVLYALFGWRARFLARAFLLAVIAWMVLTESYQWVVMVVVVTLIGVDHPPTANDNMPLGKWRYVIGLASLAIPVFCFIPTLF
jgi:membrane-associated protease RseP (regulator of RpoE activity)